MYRMVLRKVSCATPTPRLRLSQVDKPKMKGRKKPTMVMRCILWTTPLICRVSGKQMPAMHSFRQVLELCSELDIGAGEAICEALKHNAF